ncbi:MAG: helix-turn-helix domain-containing protein [Actinobacteria bacterium]|nr:helix-turn-helix domain-containing protein [Actinomycetota bacterium]
MLEPVAQAVGAQLVPADQLVEGDVPLCWQGEPLLGFRLPGLHGALERMLRAIEAEEGCSLIDLGREAKQRVVHQLDQAGAFTLRKAVEEVADALGVSRFTVYNYLNSSTERNDA